MHQDAPLAGLIGQSPTLGELFKALSAAQGEMKDPPKDKTAKAGTYSYKYSDLSDLLKIIRPVFNKYGLCLTQWPVTLARGTVTIITRIGHTSGEWMQGPGLTLSLGDEKPQTLGSAITYGRRYSGSGVAGVSPDEDDDAGVAQNAGPAKGPPPEEHGGDDIFRFKDKDQQDELIAELNRRNVPDDRWDVIGKWLDGKSRTLLSKAIVSA